MTGHGQQVGHPHPHSSSEHICSDFPLVTCLEGHPLEQSMRKHLSIISVSCSVVSKIDPELQEQDLPLHLELFYHKVFP